MLIKNAQIYTEQEMVNGHLLIEQGKIAQIYRELPQDLPKDIEVIEANYLNLIPGFIDTHIHGANGADVMDHTPESIETIAKFLVTEGTTSFLATTITQSKETIEHALANLAHYNNIDNGAEMIGIHLEGPFVEKQLAHNR